jgi:hypothetical protein
MNFVKGLIEDSYDAVLEREGLAPSCSIRSPENGGALKLR